ncbi:hypothetical protein BGX38DRAFT_1152452 [Terfezia claveryi]|nr:hypothetical protein BGX38DRAFT_1152452 [Terfezia claveryi]
MCMLKPPHAMRHNAGASSHLYHVYQRTRYYSGVNIKFLWTLIVLRKLRTNPDCIRVAYPGLYPQFIHPPTETIEDPVSDIENGILETYLPNEADEVELKIPFAIPPLVTPHEALVHIEALPRFSRRAEPTANVYEL